MSWRLPLPRLRRRDRAEAELDAELRDHVERQAADHVRAGMPDREARRRARNPPSSSPTRSGRTSSVRTRKRSEPV